MSSEERLAFSKKLNRALLQAHEKMLREKIILGQPVIYGDSNGQPIEVDPTDALCRFLEAHGGSMLDS